MRGPEFPADRYRSQFRAYDELRRSSESFCEDFQGTCHKSSGSQVSGPRVLSLRKASERIVTFGCKGSTPRLFAGARAEDKEGARFRSSLFRKLVRITRICLLAQTARHFGPDMAARAIMNRKVQPLMRFGSTLDCSKGTHECSRGRTWRNTRPKLALQPQHVCTSL